MAESDHAGDRRLAADRQVAPDRVTLAMREQGQPGAGRAGVVVVEEEMAVDDVADLPGRHLDGDPVEVVRADEPPGTVDRLMAADGRDLTTDTVPERLDGQAAEGEVALGPAAGVGVERQLEGAGQRVVEEQVVVPGPRDVRDVPLVGGPSGGGRASAQGVGRHDARPDARGPGRRSGRRSRRNRHRRDGPVRRRCRHGSRTSVGWSWSRCACFSSAWSSGSPSRRVRDRPGPARSAPAGSRSRGRAAARSRRVGHSPVRRPGRLGVLGDLLQSGLDLRLDGRAVAAGHLDEQVEALGVLDLLAGRRAGLVRQRIECADLAGRRDQGRRGAEKLPVSRPSTRTRWGSGHGRSRLTEYGGGRVVRGHGGEDADYPALRRRHRPGLRGSRIAPSPVAARAGRRAGRAGRPGQDRCRNLATSAHRGNRRAT